MAKTPLYIQSVEVDDAQIEKLTSTFKKAYKDIFSEIEKATDFGVANRQAILSQIELILTDLGTDVQAFLSDELPGVYMQGADQAVSQLTNIGAPVNIAEGFSRIHQDAIAALVDDASRAFGESLTGVNRSANLLLGRISRNAITQQIAKGVISGEGLRAARQQIKGILQEQGLSALVDKGGRKWSLDRYAEMLFRTKTVEARNRGLINRMVENEYDLVQVSRHTGSCDLCAPWEGKILSVTGKTKGYPTVDFAESEGLFHPNCRHAMNTLIPSLARKTNAYDPELETLKIDDE